MIKILNNKKLMILVNILLILVLLFSISVYRFETRKILKAEIIKINLKKAGVYKDYEMDKQKKDELNANLDDFVYVEYNFNMKDISNKMQISRINIKPIFSDSIIKNKNGLTEDEIIDMAKQVSFKITYNTYEKSNAILSYGYNMDYVKCQ